MLGNYINDYKNIRCCFYFRPFRYFVSVAGSTASCVNFRSSVGGHRVDTSREVLAAPWPLSSKSRFCLFHLNSVLCRNNTLSTSRNIMAVILLRGQYGVQYILTVFFFFLVFISSVGRVGVCILVQGEKSWDIFLVRSQT